jgi:hypothetical protein
MPDAPAIAGVCCGEHELPFHTSARSPVTESNPVASQKRIDAQDTELNWKVGDVGRVDHEAPFQVNANLPPTAMQKSTEVQETDVRGTGCGKGCGCKDDPFHSSVSTGWGFAELSPAAMQNRADTQDTAFSDKWMAPSPCAGSGVF